MTPRWRIETTNEFDKHFKKLDRAVQRRLIAYLEEIELLNDPRQRGKGLTSNRAGLWRYRVGDYRILAQILDGSVTVIALAVGKRSDIYE